MWPFSKEHPGPLWISPVRLFYSSLLAGCFLLAALVLCAIILTIIGIRIWALVLVWAWVGEAEVVAVAGDLGNALISSLFATIFWYILVLCLVLEIVFTLLVEDRDLQSGVIRQFGIVSIAQIPIIVNFLLYEISPINSSWVQSACELTAYTDDCGGFWLSLQVGAICPAAISILFCLAVWFIARQYEIRVSQKMRPKERRMGKPHPKKKVKPVPPPAGTTPSSKASPSGSLADDLTATLPLYTAPHSESEPNSDSDSDLDDKSAVTGTSSGAYSRTTVSAVATSALSTAPTPSAPTSSSVGSSSTRSASSGGSAVGMGVSSRSGRTSGAFLATVPVGVSKGDSLSRLQSNGSSRTQSTSVRSLSKGRPAHHRAGSTLTRRELEASDDDSIDGLDAALADSSDEEGGHIARGGIVRTRLQRGEEEDVGLASEDEFGEFDRAEV